MTFKVPEQDIASYYREGYIVFRQIMPASLVRDLRREADKAYPIARAKAGPDAQRIQPVGNYADKLDMKPFRDYAELPALRDAIDQVLSPAHSWGDMNILGVLLHPETTPWCTAWHRDMTLKTSRLPPEEFHDIMLDWNSANQINAPLYDDNCTWFVPGSNLRARDLPGEVAAANAPVDIGVKSAITDPAEKERACWNYTQGMPGAVQLHLNAGDFALYRPIGWHIGNYVPYRKRATLHDAIFTPVYKEWWKEWIKGGSPRWVRKPEAQPTSV
jgi:hypothetical protein